jgi:hypothetical protein
MAQTGTEKKYTSIMDTNVWRYASVHQRQKEKLKTYKTSNKIINFRGTLHIIVTTEITIACKGRVPHST